MKELKLIEINMRHAITSQKEGVCMKEILFKVPNEVVNDEVIEKQYITKKSNEISVILEDNKATGRELARELRVEYKNNDNVP